MNLASACFLARKLAPYSTTAPLPAIQPSQPSSERPRQAQARPGQRQRPTATSSAPATETTSVPPPRQTSRHSTYAIQSENIEKAAATTTETTATTSTFGTFVHWLVG